MILAWITACAHDAEEPLASGAAVDLHPDVATMLVVTWEQHGAGIAWLSWEAGGVEATSPQRVRQPGPATEVVLGVPAETEVEQIVLHLVADGRESALELGAFATGPLPELLFEGTLTELDEDTMRPEPYLLTSVDVGLIPFYGPCYTVIVDREGRIVWYRPTPDSRLTWQPRVSRFGGEIVIDESTLYTFDDTGPPTLTRLTLDLSRVETTEVPGLTIAYDELLDGSWLFDERESAFKHHLSRQYPDGTQERLWSCDPWMETYDRRPDNCATNTVLWSPERGTVLWSSYKRSIVAEIELETGALLREFGPYPGGHAFDPPESAFELQHYPHWTADGTLLLSAHDPVTGAQVAREYEVDDQAETLRMSWSAETDAWAEYAGQVQSLPSGHLLWQLGTAGVVQEITREGGVVWRLEWPDSLVGNATPIADLYGLTAR